MPKKGGKKNVARKSNVKTTVNRTLRTEFNGLSIKRMSSDPSTIVENPWFSITLVFRAKNRASLNVPDILSVLTQVLDASFSVTPQLRIVSARLWETTGKSLSVDFYNTNPYTTTNADVQQVLTDVPGRNHWAKVGYKWPRSQAVRAIDGAENIPVLFVLTGDDSSDVTCYIDILWKVAPLQAPPEPKCRFERKRLV